MAQNRPNDEGLVFQLGEEEEVDDMDQFDEEGFGGFEGADQDGQGALGLIPGVVSKAQDPRNPVDNVDPAIFGYDISKLEEKGWTKPGADLSDYFNYGLNERTWRGYCAMQAQGIESIKGKADEFIAKLLEESGGAAGGYSSSAGAAMGGGGMYSQLGIVSGGGGGGGVSGGGGGGGGYQGNNPNTSHPLYKTRLCQPFMEGSCTRGDRCTFAHGHDELRTPPEGAMQMMKPRHPNHMIGGGGGGGGGGILSGPPMPMPIHHSSAPIGYHDQSGPPVTVPTPTTLGGVLPLPPGVPMHTTAPSIITPPPTMRAPQQHAGGGGFRMVPAAKRERSPDVYEKKY